MRLQKNKSQSSVLVVMILFSMIMIGYGIFRIFSFHPVLLFDDFFRGIIGKTSKSFSRTTLEIKNGFLAFLDSPNLQKKIDQLEYEIRLNKVQISSQQNLEYENARLRLLLRLLSAKDYKLIPCDIWFRDQDNSFNFTINKGKKEQLKIEQGIIYPLEIGHSNTIKYQLIGRIQELNQSSSRVLSIFDNRSKISCRNFRSLALGNVMYDEKKKELYVLTLSENDDYRINDMIVTSDLSSLPKNIIIGIVQEIEDTKTINKKIILGTVLDFLKVTEVAAIE
jgi:cell shape-determining protein MreC